MKTMQEFAAQQLSKNQMNNIYGGGSYSCQVEGEHVAFVKADTKEAAEKQIGKIYGSSDVSCTVQ